MLVWNLLKKHGTRKKTAGTNQEWLGLVCLQHAAGTPSQADETLVIFLVPHKQAETESPAAIGNGFSLSNNIRLKTVAMLKVVYSGRNILQAFQVTSAPSQMASTCFEQIPKLQCCPLAYKDLT